MLEDYLNEKREHRNGGWTKRPKTSVLKEAYWKSLTFTKYKSPNSEWTH